MVLGDYIEERWLNPLKERRRREAEERREQARAEGAAQTQAAWEAWNERRMAAEADGEPFDEPPPGTSPTESE